MNKIKKQALVAALLLSQTISIFPLVAQAAAGDVRIAGQTVLTLANPDGGTVAQRASTIQNNLDNALVAAQDRSPASVAISYFQGTPVVTLGGYQVVTVSAADAQAAKTTPALLAQKWADSMRGALSNQASINSYVAQLTGGAPAQGSASALADSSQPANQSYNGRPPGYDTYNSSGAPQGGPQGGYPPPQQSYQPQGGPPLQQGFQPQGYPPPQQGFQPQGYPQGGYQPQGYQPQGGPPQGYRQGRVAYAPAGQVIPITLATSISTQAAQAGDLLQANITQNINLGDSVIPAGSVVLGQIGSAKAGGRLTKSGEVQIIFNRIRTPDGTETPISAHLVGGINKYTQVGGANSDTYKGENTGNKVGSVAFRGLVGAGGGAALGTAVGAIAGGGYGAGRGAWSGAAIGGGLGVADSLLLRKGADVTIKSGTQMQLQLDAPVSISGVTPGGYPGGGSGGYPPPGGGGYAGNGGYGY